MVLRLNTALEMNELFDGLQTLEGNRDVAFGGTQENLLLLSYDQEIRMMPGENLPSPKLHTDTLTLRCAAEAWGDYRHPVLGQTLQELVRLSDPLKHVEFFAQGRILFSGETT